MLGVVVVLTSSLAAKSSLAFTYTINANTCKVLQTGDELKVTTSSQNGTITAKSTNQGSIDVICPMVKHTSGPGGFNDQVLDVMASVVATPGALSCTLNLYTLQLHASDNSMIQQTPSVATTGTGTQNIDIGGFSTDTYFDNGIANPYTNWYSSELVCSMGPNTTINTFTVTENGSSLANYRIFSASSCTPTLSASSYNYFVGNLFSGLGGYWEAQQMSGFIANCPIPSDAGRGVQLAVGPSISSGGLDKLECSSDGTNWLVIPQNPLGADFPTVTVGFAVKSGTQNISCKMVGPDNHGDGKIAGYRTFPLDPIPHAGWTATASIGANTGNAFDGNLSSRWTTGQTQRSGQWFQLDMGASKTFMEVVMDSGGDANDYPHGYKIEASTNGTSWTTLTTGTGTSAVVTVPVLMTTARFIKITQTATDTHWWSIHELNVYSATPHGL